MRFSYTLLQSPATCATAAVAGVYDLTGATLLTSITVVNGQTLGLVDSGALNISMTAGLVFGVGYTTNSSGCGTQPSINSVNAVIQ